jgi:hypothetical protein
MVTLSVRAPPGQALTETPQVFHLCYLLPWQLDFDLMLCNIHAYFTRRHVGLVAYHLYPKVFRCAHMSDASNCKSNLT